MKFIYSLLSIVFPALILLIYDNPPGALIALLMQATVIGWIPASIWAWRIVHENDKEKKTVTAEDEKE